MQQLVDSPHANDVPGRTMERTGLSHSSCQCSKHGHGAANRLFPAAHVADTGANMMTRLRDVINMQMMSAHQDIVRPEHS
jgi:hypothetical protein